MVITGYKKSGNTYTIQVNDPWGVVKREYPLTPIETFNPIDQQIKNRYSLFSSGNGNTLSLIDSVTWFTKSEVSQNPSSPIAFVTQWYTGYLKTNPDQDGLNFWVQHLKSRVNCSDLALDFLKSVNFNGNKSAQISNSSFLDRLYSGFLNRAPDSPGKAFWLDKLLTGSASRSTVAIELFKTAEYKNRCP